MSSFFFVPVLCGHLKGTGALIAYRASKNIVVACSMLVCDVPVLGFVDAHRDCIRGSRRLGEQKALILGVQDEY